MDKPGKSLVLFRAMADTDKIPDFFVYGEPSRLLEIDFMHVETVMERKSVHFGEVAPHKHMHMAQITFWYRGGGTYRYEDRSFEFSAPAISFMPSGVVHGFSVGANTDAIVISLADEGLETIHERLGAAIERPLFIASREGDAQWQHLDQLAHMTLAEYRMRDGESRHVLAGLVQTILALTRRMGRADAQQPSPSHALGVALRRMIDRHYREDWPVARYAEELATTRHLLDKAAREAFGKSVKAMILERRLIEAKRLLMFTIRSVEDIGRESGFDDPAYFSRFFRKHTGASPTEWRALKLDQQRPLNAMA